MEERNTLNPDAAVSPTIEQLKAQIAAMEAKKPNKEHDKPEDVPALPAADPEQEVAGTTILNGSPDVQEEPSQPAMGNLNPLEVSESAGLPDALLYAAGPGQVTAAGIIDQVRKECILERITAVLNNTRFWEVESRVDKLEDAAVIPMFDDKSLQGFATSAEKELIRKAAEYSAKYKTVTVMPTVDQIRKLALEKHQEKQDKEAKKALKKNK